MQIFKLCFSMIKSDILIILILKRMEKFDTAKSFSKETQKEERIQQAETIHAQRKEYFDNKKNLQNHLQELLADAEAKKIEASVVRQNIESAEANLEEGSHSFFRKVLERNKIRRLE